MMTLDIDSGDQGQPISCRLRARGPNPRPASLPNRGHFMKDQQDKIVAVDFGASCFLPVSFFAFVLVNSLNPFTQSIAQLITYPKPTLEQTNALLAAHQALVPHVERSR